jgi:hypothetical protein
MRESPSPATVFLVAMHGTRQELETAVDTTCRAPHNRGLMNLSRISNATVAVSTRDVSALVLVLGVLVLGLGLLLGSPPGAG